MDDPNFNIDDFDLLKDKYGYPFNDTCFETFTSGKIRTKKITDYHNEDDTVYDIFPNDPNNMTVDVDGFVNNYKGGYSKSVKMNLTDPEFFRNLFTEEIIDQGWSRMKASVAVIMQFYVYNPNMRMIAEKSIGFEFLEPGGFINVEHTIRITNTKLFRKPIHKARSAIIIILGIFLFFLSYKDILQDDLEAREREQEESG